MSNALILSIETSCDDTAISILRSSDEGLEILASEVSSQIKLHAKWGGVVPNLAAREHVKNIDHLLKFALQQADVLPEHIDVIAVTQGPGLIPALLVGVSYAKTLSYLWEKPLLGIHHIEGHIYANFIREVSKAKPQTSKEKTELQFPILALVVSGGHTQIVLMKDHLKYEIIGQTLDDAIGEAFDKVARILGIGYPGGPAVATWAAKYETWNTGHEAKNKKNNTRNQNGSYRMQDSQFKIQFPRPMLNKKNYDFSFSGLKTAVLYETKKHPELLRDKKYIAEICHEFQQAAVDVLVAKTIKAAESCKPKTILLAGGVSANKELREQLGEAIEKNLSEVSYVIPALSLTGDNAAMIAAAASFRWNRMSDVQRKKTKDAWKTMQPHANLKMN